MQNLKNILANFRVLGKNNRSLSIASDDYVRNLSQALLTGRRDALAKSITLIESTRVDHQESATKLFEYISTKEPRTMSPNSLFKSSYTFRLGIAGPPGAGKSTFIEAFGLRLISQNLKVAVIPVDPSSHISGGSILGDKTRMEQLTRSDNSYIRASPTRGVLGGIAEHTADVVTLCEAAKYDVTIIESVGLGQSEVDIDMAADMLLVVLPPGGGDSLQASKKGIMEAADMIAVNKADGDLLATAKHTKADYSGTMQFIRQKHNDWKVPVVLMSSRTGLGLDEIEKNIVEFHDLMSRNGSLLKKRESQASHWMSNQFQRLIISNATKSDKYVNTFNSYLSEVTKGSMTSRQAASLLFHEFGHRK